MSGTLYGLGVGPGDPDLITLKALKILKHAPVIAYPAPPEGDSLARAIAAPHIPKDRTEIVIRTPMLPGVFPAHDVYDHYAGEIGVHLAKGRDVAVLCEGDPFLYGSFMYLFTRLSGVHRAEVVPGVSSLGACAAAAGMPLVSRNQVLSVLPGPLDEKELETRIRSSPAVAVMKVGRHLDKICRVLDRLGLMDHAHYIEHATMAEQQVLPLRDVNGAGAGEGERKRAPYFSMILVRHGEAEAGI